MLNKKKEELMINDKHTYLIEQRRVVNKFVSTLFKSSSRLVHFSGQREREQGRASWSRKEKSCIKMMNKEDEIIKN